MMLWKRTESRVVRPFQSVEEALADVRLRLRPNTEFDDRTSFDIAELKNGELQPEFCLVVRRCSLDNLRKLCSSDLSLVIRLIDPHLHRSELVFEELIDNLPSTWIVPNDVVARFSWKPGFTVSVAIVLRKNKRPEPGLPFMRGQWLARKNFSIVSPRQQRMFPIERWTAEDFSRYDLPRDTVYWMLFTTDNFNSRVDDPADVLRVCIRADVYDLLLNAQDNSYGPAIMSLFMTEILTEVLWRGFENIENNDEIEKGSLLHSAVTSVERATGKNASVIRRVVKEQKDLATLRAFAQATVNAREELIKLKNIK